MGTTAIAIVYSPWGEQSGAHLNPSLTLTFLRLGKVDPRDALCPAGSGRMMTLWEVAAEISRRLTRIFLRGPDGRRPVHGAEDRFQHDLHWRDLVLFYEYFHGDDGSGVGASHQTGWTGLVAKLIQQSGEQRR